MYLPSGEALTSKDYYVTFDGKSKYGYRPSTSVVFLQSDCDTMSGREDYVKELMKHLPIDSYGSCLRNRDLPERQVGYSICILFIIPNILHTHNKHAWQTHHVKHYRSKIPLPSWHHQVPTSFPRSVVQSAGCSCTARCLKWATFPENAAVVRKIIKI